MIRQFGRSTRALTILLALWFLGLNASIQFFHLHPDRACCAATAYGDSTRLASPDGGAPAPHSRFAGLCPACLFLAKYLAQWRAEPPEPTPSDAATAWARPAAPAGIVTLHWPTTTPRAPPR